MACPSTRAERRKRWADSLVSEPGYTGMLCSMFFLYLVLALISLAPNGTVGKISPIQEAVQRNGYLRNLLKVTGVQGASVLSLQASFFLLLIFLLAAYFWALLVYRRRDDKGLFSILWPTVLICALLVILPPLVSKDLFSNIFYGKIAARYSANPYLATPQQFPNDRLMAYVSLNWKNTAIVYGPLHTYLSIVLNLLAGHGVTANIYVFKSAMAFFHLANVLLLWSILGFHAPQRRAFGTMLYAWNPIALAVGVGGAHNDLMMMTFLLLSLLFLLQGRKWAGFLFLCLSVLVKYVTVILLVALVLYLVREEEDIKGKVRALFLHAAFFALLFFLLFFPFWEGFRTFDSTVRNLQLNNFSSVGGLLGHAFALFLEYVVRLPHSLAVDVGGVLSKALLLPVFFVVLWSAPRRVRRRGDIPHCFFAVTLAFLLTTSYYMPWYFLWILPLVPLREWDRLSRYTLVLGTATIFLGCDLHPY